MIALLALAPRFMPGRVRPALVTVGGVGTAGLFALALALGGHDRLGAYFGSSARAWEIGVGVVLALATPALVRTPPMSRAALMPAGLVLVIASAFVIDSAAWRPAPAVLLPVLGTALVIVGSGGSHLSPLAWPLTNRYRATSGGCRTRSTCGTGR